MSIFDKELDVCKVLTAMHTPSWANCSKGLLEIC